ncbi:glycine zipper 2TM domain-containing protein [Novilysobacter erysipheiresistens]|uniref:Glycine zipper 2TM domain-containing protein n=1 Tax=Novilysobacter erysipheiresistens TaxID=1749332 RepID=A0ABU7Z112_9GAMM
MNKNMIAVALASLLVGGVAVAAYQSFQGDSQDNALATNADLAAGLDGDLAADGSIDGVEFADVVGVEPIKEKQEIYATVIGTDPVRETSTTSTPRQVCEDVVVQDRAPERDGNIGGTVVGALIGGALGNQVGGGNGKKAATVAGAVAGGYIGNKVDKRHVGGQVTERVETNCRTVSDTSQSTKVVGYNVTYRNPDGTTGSMRTGSKPGERISLGSEDQVVGYDVTYSYKGQQQTVRLDERPGERLPVINGEVVTQTASAEVDATTNG